MVAVLSRLSRTVVAASALGLVATGLVSAAPSPAAAAPTTAVVPHQRVVYGHSVKHRPLVVDIVGDVNASKRILVVGCIHGNECDGKPIIRKLEDSTPPADTVYYLVPTANPDGEAANTRQNAHGVDLNKNFPGRWAHNGHRWSTYYSGPHALSEPESRAMWKLVNAVHPTLSIWYHQHMDVVDFCGGSKVTARAYAKRAHMHLTQLTRFRGSVATSEHLYWPHVSVLTVELPAHVSAGLLTRSAAAVRLAASTSPGVPGTPAVPTATADAAHYVLTWSAVSGNGRRVDRFDVADRTKLSDGTWSAWSVTVKKTQRSRAVPAADGSTHQARVRAHNVVGWGHWSPVRTVTLPAAAD